MPDERDSKSNKPKIIGAILLGLLIFVPATIVVIAWPEDTIFGVPPSYILVVGIVLYVAQIVREHLMWIRSKKTGCKK